MSGWKIWISSMAASLMIAGVLIGRSPTLAQQPACLHGTNEIPAEQARRQEALRLTRQVNTAQSAAYSQAGMFQPVERLAPAPTPPQGFVVHLATDGERYVFSVKDTLDPCHFAYFSDENGVIYTGQALR
jgi:hypothetical protein